MIAVLVLFVCPVSFFWLSRTKEKTTAGTIETITLTDSKAQDTLKMQAIAQQAPVPSESAIPTRKITPPMAPAEVILFEQELADEYSTWKIVFTDSDEDCYTFKIYPEGSNDDSFDYIVSRTISASEMDSNAGYQKGYHNRKTPS